MIIYKQKRCKCPAFPCCNDDDDDDDDDDEEEEEEGCPLFKCQWA